MPPHPFGTSQGGEQRGPSNQALKLTAARRCGISAKISCRAGGGSLALSFGHASMAPRPRQQIAWGCFAISVLFGMGTLWFLFFGGGYQAELWLARYDRGAADREPNGGQAVASPSNGQVAHETPQAGDEPPGS